MLQIQTMPYASDALEDAMRLAQTKALNSYTFSDCINELNYSWMDMYHKLALADEGYYSKTVRLTQRLTRLPPFVKNTIRVYAAQQPVGFSRQIYRASGYADLNSPLTYHISGFDLYCPDALRRTVWLNYIPMQPQIFFTHRNRDPKLYSEWVGQEPSVDYNIHTLKTVEVDRTVDPIPFGKRYYLVHKGTENAVEITASLVHDNEWEPKYISCHFPYIFVSHRHYITGEWLSGMYRDILNDPEFYEYNPFAFTGRNSNVEYLKCSWNDKTGMGVVIRDHNDGGQVKELGWTPDTLLNYPCPEMYRLLVARLAVKFASLNESDVMGANRALTDAEYAFDTFCKKDKSAWVRIDNVNTPTLGDLL